MGFDRHNFLLSPASLVDFPPMKTKKIIPGKILKALNRIIHNFKKGDVTLLLDLKQTINTCLMLGKRIKTNLKYNYSGKLVKRVIQELSAQSFNIIFLPSNCWSPRCSGSISRSSRFVDSPSDTFCFQLFASNTTFLKGRLFSSSDLRFAPLQG